MHKFDINTPASKHNPFVIPEGYLNTFTQNIIDQIKGQKSLSQNPPFVRWIPFVGAACISFLFILFSQHLSLHNNNNDESKTATIEATFPSTYEDALYDYLLLANDKQYITYDDFE